jgi:hypothetical protein
MMRAEDSHAGGSDETLSTMSWSRILRAIVLLPGAMTVLLPALLLYLGEGPDVGFGITLPLALAP